MRHNFWMSAGTHLLDVNDDGWLTVTPAFLRAYLMRPEVQPIDESCENEFALHEALMRDPTMPVAEASLAALKDDDAADNYRVLLAFRDALLTAGTIEGAYLKLTSGAGTATPSIFLDQLVHVILRHILKDVSDPMQLRAAELFFRAQNVSLDEGRVLLADEEIVDMHAKAKTGEVNLVQLLADESGHGAMGAKTVELDVIGEDNADIYWARSDKFDTVIDFRLTLPASDAFARVVEAWIAHLARLQVNVQPVPNIDDDDWCWHIGMDAEANRILNLLYQGESPTSEELAQIIGLFDMKIRDDGALLERAQGKPVHLALAMTADDRLRMKPQNLIANLPLAKAN